MMRSLTYHNQALLTGNTRSQGSACASRKSSPAPKEDLTPGKGVSPQVGPMSRRCSFSRLESYVPFKQLFSRKISVAAFVSLGAVAALLFFSGAGHGHSRAKPAAAANTSMPEVTVAAVI